MRERTVRTDDGVELFCRIEGRGDPVLLIHGAMVDADFFREVQEFLSRRYRVITYDRRGYSRSSQGEDYSLRRQAEDAACVLRALTKKKAVVIGCSAGAIIALKLKEICPDSVSWVYVHEPPIVTLDGVLNPEIEKWLAGIYEKIGRGKIRSAVADFVVIASANMDPRAKPLQPEAMQQQLDNGKIFIAKEFPEIFDRSFKPVDYAALKEKDKITVLAGDSSGETYATRATRALAEQLGTEICYVAGGHNGARDLPLEFASVIMGLMSLYKGV